MSGRQNHMLACILQPARDSETLRRYAGMSFSIASTALRAYTIA